jgi:spore coat protein U-like protein
MKLTKLFLALTTISAVVFASDSQLLAAGSKTANFNVTAAVVANCSISAADIAFGSYDPLATSALTSNGKVTVQCTKGAAITVGLSGGSNLAAPYNQMKSPTANSFLQYQLYQDSGFAKQWSDSIPTGSGASMAITVGTLSPVDYTIYGRIPAGQPASVAADYADVVTATVNF